MIRTHDIMIKGQIIDMVDLTKFLGVHIDACLSWRHHIQNIRNKIAKGLGIICEARKVLQQSTLLTLYNSFILPYLTYCIEIWGMTFKSHLLKSFDQNPEKGTATNSEFTSISTYWTLV